MIEEKKEYKDSWDLPDAAPAEDQDEFARKGEAEELALSQQLKAGGGEKVAALDKLWGPTDLLSPAERKAYKDATGEDIHGSPTPAPAPAPNNNPGKDDKVTTDWKARNFDRQRQDGVQKLMKLRNLTRDQAEKLIPISQ